MFGKGETFFCQHKQNKSKRYQISPNSLTHAGSRHKQKKHIYIYIFVAFFLFPLPSHKRKHDLVHTLFTKKTLLSTMSMNINKKKASFCLFQKTNRRHKNKLKPWRQDAKSQRQNLTLNLKKSKLWRTYNKKSLSQS